MSKYYDNPYTVKKIKVKFPIKEIKDHGYDHFKSPPKYLNNTNYYINEDYRNNDYINPYEILNISTQCSIQECRNAYLKLATHPNREIRSKACLAYDALCNKEKYINVGNYYKVKNKDCFYYTVVGDLHSLKNAINYNKSLLYQKDGLNRSLLYLSARNGYFNLTEFLIKKGININEVQRDGSSALHGAAYYGQELVVQLLIEYGININIRNKFGSTAADEARTPFIKELILRSQEDRIMNLYQYLFSKGLVSNFVIIKKKGKVVAKKLMCSNKILPYNFPYINKNWIPVWHGTKFKFLESILVNGLKPSGSKLSNGTRIIPLPGHISINETVSGIKNWAKAVFVSPSIFYASDPIYAERINSNSERWAVLIEARVKPFSYTAHNSTVFQYVAKCGESTKVEYRVVVNDNDSDYIYRVSQENNIVIKSISFVKVNFLENVTNYVEGNIVVNSKEEQMLLE
jgi:hypothetical protein